MKITHKNRKGDIYYLHEGKTKTGKPKYFFSTKDEGNLVKKMPDGYELFENSNAQVFLRKIQPKIISDNEVAIIKSCMEECKHIRYWQVEVKKNTIIIHTSKDSANELSEVFGSRLYATKKDVIDKLFERNIHYMPMFKFTLVDPINRKFDLGRQFFRGDGGWMIVDFSKDLKKLAKKYCKYLNTEKFYELC